MPKALHLEIPQPCHENWQQMTPNEQGRHCMSCQKTVVDFTMMSDKEVLEYFNKTTSQVCGRFADDQLKRDIAIAPPQKKKWTWGYFWSMLITGLLVSGKTYSQGEPALKKVKPVEQRPDEGRDMMILGNIMSARIEPAADLVTIWGMVFDKQTGKPLQGVSIVHQQTGKNISSDKNGAFSLKKVQKKKTQIRISCPGYETQVRDLTPSMDWKKINIQLHPVKVALQPVLIGKVAPRAVETLTPIIRKNSSVTGRVYDAATGKPVSGASIRIAGSSNGTAADAEGLFYWNTGTSDEVTIEVSSIGYASQTKTIKKAEYHGELLSFPMTMNADLLQGAVVIGYGTTTCTGMTGGVSSSYVLSRSEKTRRKINDWVPAILKKDVQVYPNPIVRGNAVNVVLRLPKTGEYKGELIAANGQIVAVRSIQVANEEQRISIPTESAWSAGVYWLRITHPQLKKVYQNKVVVQ